MFTGRYSEEAKSLLDDFEAVGTVTYNDGEITLEDFSFNEIEEVLTRHFDEIGWHLEEVDFGKYSACTPSWDCQMLIEVVQEEEAEQFHIVIDDG